MKAIALAAVFMALLAAAPAQAGDGRWDSPFGRYSTSLSSSSWYRPSLDFPMVTGDGRSQANDAADAAPATASGFLLPYDRYNTSLQSGSWLWLSLDPPLVGADDPSQWNNSLDAAGTAPSGFLVFRCYQGRFQPYLGLGDDLFTGYVVTDLDLQGLRRHMFFGVCYWF